MAFREWTLRNVIQLLPADEKDAHLEAWEALFSPGLLDEGYKLPGDLVVI